MSFRKFLDKLLAKFGYVRKRKLQAAYTIEKAESLEKEFGLDIADELAKTLSEEIGKENPFNLDYFIEDMDDNIEALNQVVAEHRLTVKEDIREAIKSVMNKWRDQLWNAETSVLFNKDVSDVCSGYEFETTWNQWTGVSVYVMELELLVTY